MWARESKDRLQCLGAMEMGIIGCPNRARTAEEMWGLLYTGSFGFSTELDQASGQNRLATSERRCAKAALRSQSGQFKKRAIYETKNGLSTQETPHMLLPSQSSCSVLIAHLSHPALFMLPTGLETLLSGTQGFFFPPGWVRKRPPRFSAISQQAKRGYKLKN